MRALAASAVGLAVASLLGLAPAGRRAPRGRPDGGPILLGTDPPGKLRPEPPERDGGAVARLDAGVDATRAEVQQLRARVDMLERQQAVLQQQAQQLSEIARELQQIRSELSNAEQRRQSEEQAQAARRDQLQSGLNAIYQAQSMLAGGNSAIEDQIEEAQGGFPPQARRDLDAARTALQNRDLSAARAYLSAAIADAQQGK